MDDNLFGNYKKELSELEEEHQEIHTLIETSPESLDELTGQRLKKRKLYIKDKISGIKSKAYPDIIA